MEKQPISLDPAPYDPFFDEVVDRLHGKLAPQLRGFQRRKNPGKGWLTLTYPELPYSMYELHLSSRSKNHAAYFGEGPVNVLAFYYGEPVSREARLRWIEAMRSEVPKISHQTGKAVVVGEWGEAWAWLALRLSDEDLREGAVSDTFALFIRASYKAVKEAMGV